MLCVTWLKFELLADSCKSFPKCSLGLLQWHWKNRINWHFVPLDSPHKGPVMPKTLPCHAVIIYASERQVHSLIHNQSTCREQVAASYSKLFPTPNKSWIGRGRYWERLPSQRKTTGTHSITGNLGSHNRLIPWQFCPCITSRDNACTWSSHYTLCTINLIKYARGCIVFYFVVMVSVFVNSWEVTVLCVRYIQLNKRMVVFSFILLYVISCCRFMWSHILIVKY